MKTIAGVGRRPGRRREESRTGEWSGLFNQSDQRRSIAGYACQPKLVAFDAELRNIGVVGKDLGER